jgi:hypothetical protein
MQRKGWAKVVTRHPYLGLRGSRPRRWRHVREQTDRPYTQLTLGKWQERAFSRAQTGLIGRNRAGGDLRSCRPVSPEKLFFRLPPLAGGSPLGSGY